MIDVIIPAYNSQSTIVYTLMSIGMQTIIDKINVCIIDDASNTDYTDIVNQFDFNINVLRLKNNMGTGYALEYGIKKTNSDYILFLDSDDLLYNPESIEILYNNISSFDLVNGYVYNEKNKYIGYTSGDLHGKLYRRKFIIENDIHFNNSRFHEDNAFHNLVIIHGAKEIKIEDIIYFYTNNNKSITNSSKDNHLDIYIDNMKYVIDVSLSHNCNCDLINNYIFNKYQYLGIVYYKSDDKYKIMIKEKLKKYNFKCFLEDNC